jgi:hypothetical protein
MVRNLRDAQSFLGHLVVPPQRLFERLCSLAQRCVKELDYSSQEWLTLPSFVRPLFRKRLGALAGLLKNILENLELFGMSIGKHSADFGGVLAEDWNNQVFTGLCKRDDSYPPIVRVFRPAHQSFFEQAIDRDADGTGSEVDLRPYGVHRQRPFVQKGLQDAEVRVGNARLLESSIQKVAHSLVCFPPNEPTMHGGRGSLGHSSLMLNPF